MLVNKGLQLDWCQLCGNLGVLLVRMVSYKVAFAWQQTTAEYVLMVIRICLGPQPAISWSLSAQDSPILGISTF